MCGIFGMLYNGAQPEELENAGRLVLKALRHRGPDGEGLWVRPGIALGHTRLSIIDEEGGSQPMSCLDGRYVITFNGEIFNYRSLRSTLESHHRFQTDSDTEVLLALYLNYGTDSLKKLHGMFSFAIFDTHTGSLFAARDRFGIKPFYYSQSPRGLVFCSEIRPLLQAGILTFEPEKKHFNEFLVYGYVAGPETLHRNVKELEPSHYLIWTNDTLKTYRYWYPFSEDRSKSDEEAIEEIDARVQQAVRMWMVSDVSAGALVSGGVDSPIVTTLASKMSPGILAVSATFPDSPEIDESEQIAEVVDNLNVNRLELKFREDSIVQDVETLAAHFDEPIVDPNNITLMRLCRIIKEKSGLKVLLCGEGADELFGGYERHVRVADELSNTKEHTPLIFAMNRVAIPRLQLFCENTEIYSPFRRELVTRLRSKTPLNRVLEVDQLTFLNTRLHSQDRVGMFSGIEIRTPFLEHSLAEVINSLPDGMKVRDGIRKWLLRRVAEKYVPRNIAWLAKKTGLAAPAGRWLANGPIRDLFLERMSEHATLSQYYSMAGIRTLLNKHDPTTPGGDASNTLWRLLSLELWLRSW